MLMRSFLLNRCTCILPFQPPYHNSTNTPIPPCQPQASPRHCPTQSTTHLFRNGPTPKMYESSRPHLPDTPKLTPQSRFQAPRLTRLLRKLLIASYNLLSEAFLRSDTKPPRKRSSFRDQMRRPWRKQKNALPLCPDCGAMTVAEWEQRSCLSSFEVHRHRGQTLPEKAA